MKPDFFRIALLCIDLMVALACFAMTYYVRATVNEQLRSYVPNAAFVEYQKSQERVNTLAKENIDARLDSIDKRVRVSEDNNSILIELRADVKHLKETVDRLIERNRVAAFLSSGAGDSR